jgi:GrpB-like predicted nucleotidyltransferase (UPF0157 family)
MKFEKYKFKKYNKDYPLIFEKEKVKLKKIFPKSEIEHIGSTSIKGLGGKGIIDMQVGMRKSQIKKSMKLLQDNNYDYIEKGSDLKERWMFEKDFIFHGISQRLHVHLTLIDSDTWNKCILFRDKLRNDKKLVKEYSDLKKKALSKNLKNENYVNYKKEFVRGVENKK